MSPSRPKARGSLRQDAYELILSAIIFGDLAPGSSVDEKRLAKDFDIGIAVVRDALFRLSLEKMVVRHARIGTVIPPLGLKEVQEVFEARVIYEGYCAGLAAERASPAEVATLKSSFDGYKAAIAKREFRELVRMDQVFHRTLAAACRNSYMEQDLVVLHNNASRFWYFGIQRLPSKALISDIDAHLVVADAIAARDSKSANIAMQQVLQHFPEHVGGLLIAPPAFDRPEPLLRMSAGGRGKR